MTTLLWPSGAQGEAGALLPHPLRSGYGYTPRSPSVSTDFGLASRTRQVFSDAPVDFDGLQWLCSWDQWLYMEGFWWRELAGGSRWVLMPLQIGRAVQLVEVHFLGRPLVPQLVGAQRYRVTGSVRTRNGVQISAEDWESIQTALGVLGSLEALRAILTLGGY